MPTDYPYVVPRTSIEAFARDGFVVTPGVFSEAELVRFAGVVDAEVERRASGDTRALADKTTYEQSFIQCMRLWETSPGVAPLTCHAGLAGIAAQLLAVASVRLWQDQALYKEPGGRETTAHQDQTFWPLGSEPLISAWIPFDDVDVNNGAMGYVPGSHRAGRLRVVDITHTTEPYDVLSDPLIADVPVQWVEVPAGSVVWHHGLTVHQATANTTRRPRRVFTVVYLDAEARRWKDWPVFPLDRAGVATGERIEGVGMPVLWPPPPELPVPPEDHLRGVETGAQMRFRDRRED